MYVVVQRLVTRQASCSHTHTAGLLVPGLIQLPGDANPVSAYTSAEDRKRGLLIIINSKFSLHKREVASQALGKGEVMPFPILVWSQTGLQ